MRQRANISTPHAAPGPARGIVRTPALATQVEHRRLLPSSHLEPFIAHYWEVRWSLRISEWVETLAHPSVHIVFEQSSGCQRADVAGIPSMRFRRELVGNGRVFGIKFRPAMFRAVLGNSVSALSDRVVPLATILGPIEEPLSLGVFASNTFEDRIFAAESHLSSLFLTPSPALVILRNLVERVAADPSILRVEQLSTLASIDRRTLERRFREDVGVAPKWVIQRYRIHEAAERLKTSAPPSLSALAATLGYADQAHFSRDFKASMGCTPRQFAQRCRSTS